MVHVFSIPSYTGVPRQVSWAISGFCCGVVSPVHEGAGILLSSCWPAVSIRKYRSIVLHIRVNEDVILVSKKATIRNTLNGYQDTDRFVIEQVIKQRYFPDMVKHKVN